MRLDERLIEERTTDGRIDFHEHISRVRKEASNWLEGIEKNGIDHSKRLEGYLDRLIPEEFKEKFKPAEIFILLYAVQPRRLPRCVMGMLMNLFALFGISQMISEIRICVKKDLTSGGLQRC
jgi:hypothetical protein